MEPSSSSKSAGNTPKTAIATKWRAYIQRLPPDQRPVVIQEVQQKKPGVVDHTYTDFSKVPCPTEGYVVPKKIIDMSFPQKVYHILCQSEYDQTVCWMPHGRAFKVRSSRSFEVQVCPQYFGHASIFLFKRELLKHGFKSITRGQDRNCFYHELLLRGRLHLCAFIPRGVGGAQSLQPDPKNEPDFYGISILFPLHTQPPTATREISLTSRKPEATRSYTSEESKVAPLAASALSTTPLAAASILATTGAGENPASHISLPPLNPDLALLQALMSQHPAAAGFQSTHGQTPTSASAFQPLAGAASSPGFQSTHSETPSSAFSFQQPSGATSLYQGVPTDNHPPSFLSTLRDTAAPSSLNRFPISLDPSNLHQSTQAFGGVSAPQGSMGQLSFGSNMLAPQGQAASAPPPLPPPDPPQQQRQHQQQDQQRHRQQQRQQQQQQPDLTEMMSQMVAQQRQQNAQQNNELLQAVLAQWATQNDTNGAALLSLLLGGAQQNQQQRGGDNNTDNNNSNDLPPSR